MIKIKWFLIYFIFTTAFLEGQNILVWSDEFNGTELNTNNWSYELGNGCPNLCGWGNNELQSYTDNNENIKVQNGHLIITALNTGGNWTSARIRSLNKFDFCLGTIEVRAKIPEGRGFWPAAWFLPSEYYYGIWPISGEIDLMEARGQEPEKTLGTIHFGPLFPNNQYNGNEYVLPSGSFADDFHVFSIEWTSESIIWKVDGIQFSEKTRADVGDFRWPFDRNFHALLNCAVGGNFLGNPDGSTPNQGDFEIDYIRVYQNPINMIISGPEAIIRSNDSQKFYTQDIPGYAISWSVPDGTQILSGQGTKEVLVQWGFSSGNIEAIYTNAQQFAVLSHFVQVLPDSCSEVFDDRNEFIRLYWVGGDGGYSAFEDNPAVNALNPSQQVARYQRNAGSQYDVLQFSTDLIKNATPFEIESYKVQVKVYSSAPVGTEIQVLFEKRGLLSQPFPIGRRTILSAFTTATNQWEILTFEFVTTPDLNLLANEIDQFTVLVAPNTFTNPVLYFDDWAIKEVPCLIASSELVVKETNILEVHPNPFSSQIKITSEHDANFVLMDISGKMIFQSSNSTVMQSFIVSDIPQGIYLFQAQSLKDLKTIKLIKN
jgi:beta-glucanase (GH16 family)